MYVFLSPGCPAGFFMSAGSAQCFKFFPEKGALGWGSATWYEANATCESEGLMMALPIDDVAVALREDLLYTYGKQYLLSVIYKTNINHYFS